jgi:uncharacterized RDD family membrane protein YckC
MQAYQQFAVYPLRNGLPVFSDGTEQEVLRTVGRNTRLPVIRREGDYYIVRVMGQVGFVPVEEVSANRWQEPKLGDSMTSGVKPAPQVKAVAVPRAASAGDDNIETGLAQLGFVQASFMTRLWAFVIDLVIVYIAGGVLGAIAVGLFDLTLFHETFIDGEKYYEPNWGDWATMYLFVTPFIFIYYVVGTATMGTIGKVLMKIQVIDNNTGRAPDLAGAIVRVIISWVGTIPFYLGYFWALWGGGRTWHDLAANTSVVQYR